MAYQRLSYTAPFGLAAVVRTICGMRCACACILPLCVIPERRMLVWLRAHSADNTVYDRIWPSRNCRPPTASLLQPSFLTLALTTLVSRSLSPSSLSFFQSDALLAICCCWNSPSAPFLQFFQAHTRPSTPPNPPSRLVHIRCRLDLNFANPPSLTTNQPTTTTETRL